MLRFQTKANVEKDWKDPGPDLLRTRANAKREIKDDLAEYGAGWYVRGKGPNEDQWSKWSGPHDRADLLDGFDDWSPKDKTVAQWGRKDADGKLVAKGAVRIREIQIVHRSGCTDETDKVVALAEAGFPQGAYGGTYVCKQISGSSSWSQHAYGAAYDHSAYDQNDDAADWLARMARENRDGDIQLPVWQILGSRNGNVGSFQNGDDDWIGDFPWSAGGCDSSHEWHCHISAGKKKKTGTPSCASRGGFEDPPPDEAHEATDAEEE